MGRRVPNRHLPPIIQQGPPSRRENDLAFIFPPLCVGNRMTNPEAPPHHRRDIQEAAFAKKGGSRKDDSDTAEEKREHIENERRVQYNK